MTKPTLGTLDQGRDDYPITAHVFTVPVGTYRIEFNLGESARWETSDFHMVFTVAESGTFLAGSQCFANVLAGDELRVRVGSDGRPQ